MAYAVAHRRNTGAAPLGRRCAAQVVGSLLVAFGVSVTLATDIGVGPLDVFNIGLAEQFGLPLSVAMWSVAAAMMLLATLLGNPPRPGTLITPFVVGALIEPIASALERLASLPLAGALAVQAVAVLTIGLGAGAIVVSGFGAGLGELISEATSWRFGRSMSATRLGLEASLFALGTAIGGPFGPGTILIAVLIGPAVSRGVRLTEPMVSGRRPGSLSTFRHRREVREADRALVRQ